MNGNSAGSTHCAHSAMPSKHFAAYLSGSQKNAAQNAAGNSSAAARAGMLFLRPPRLRRSFTIIIKIIVITEKI